MSAEASLPGTGSRSGQASLPRSTRLLKSSDFKRVFEKNAGSTDAFFRIIARPSGKASNRIGLAVSKKVDKRAVGRNRIKRVVRESFRHWRAGQEQGAMQALDIVVLARSPSADTSNEQLFRSLERHWSRLPPAVKRKFPGNRQPEED